MCVIEEFNPLKDTNMHMAQNKQIHVSVQWTDDYMPVTLMG